ncbi:uncharacterized protein LOC126740578 [Anthonomus grandis grandis]|uniref:uncharacterized protein LOC126740578 n=1 Tax=Anthonomus grandis grandis TaxID=2921223 RepID=UPI002165316E|nr:uncharacterized protein LOC126740578 [Anthonomus grandis grandis]
MVSNRFLEDCPSALMGIQSMVDPKEHFIQASSCLSMVPQTLATALEKFLYIINSVHCKEGQVVSECKACYRESPKKCYTKDFYKIMKPKKDHNIKAISTLYFQSGSSYGMGFDKNHIDKGKGCYEKQEFSLITKMASLKTHLPLDCTTKLCLHKFFLRDNMVHQIRDVKTSLGNSACRSSEILLAKIVEFYVKCTLNSSDELAFIDRRYLSVSWTTIRCDNQKSLNKNGSEINNNKKDWKETDGLIVANGNCKKCIVINITKIEQPRSCLKRGSSRGRDINDVELDITKPKKNIKKPEKRVKFAPPNQLCEVHPMIKWSYAYQAARKGPWEMHARDRDRFRWRIFRVEQDIKYIFDQEHRNKIYNERFRNV